MDLEKSESTANTEVRTALRRREVALHRGRSVGAEGGAGVEKTRLKTRERDGIEALSTFCLSPHVSRCISI